MTDIKTDVQAIRDFIAPVMPGAAFKLQHMPVETKVGDVSIRYQTGRTTTETAAHYRIDRTYQIVYFGTSELDCVVKVAAMDEKLNTEFTIPTATRPLSIGSFSLSQAFKTESGQYAIIGMLEVTARKERPRVELPKVENVETRTYTDKTAESWETFESPVTDDFLPAGYTFDDVEAGVNVFGKTANPDGFTWDDIASGKTVFTEEDE